MRHHILLLTTNNSARGAEFSMRLVINPTLLLKKKKRNRKRTFASPAIINKELSLWARKSRRCRYNWCKVTNMLNNQTVLSWSTKQKQQQQKAYVYKSSQKRTDPSDRSRPHILLWSSSTMQLVHRTSFILLVVEEAPKFLISNAVPLDPQAREINEALPSHLNLIKS